MFNPPGSRLSPAEFSLRLDEAKARAKVLREQAIREMGSSLLAALGAAGRRLAHGVRPARTPGLPVRAAAQPAR